MKSICLLAVTLAATTFLHAGEKRLWADSFLGKPAPKFQAETWLTDAPDCSGKYVLIDFWATWCGPCRKAIPELNAIHRKFADRLVVIGMSDEPEEEVRAMKAPKIQYFSAVDTQARMKKALGVRGIPHVIIMDPKGIVRWEGYPLLSGHELTEEAVEEILDGKSP